MPEHTRSLPPDEIAERLQTFSQSRESVADVLGAPALQAQAPLVNRSPFEAHSKAPHVQFDEADAGGDPDVPRPKKARPPLTRAPSAFQENQRYRSMRFRERPGKVFTARDEANLINIPKNFQAKEGTPLTDKLHIGKHISSGLQGGVYFVKDKEGQEVDLVVKVVHKHALLAEVEREWEVGLRLGFLADEDGSLPGFMGTGAGLCDETGRFRGMLLERLDGRVVEKVIMRPEFADVYYLRAMLLSVFTALGKAQSWLGFHHSDLRLANVMEIFSPRKSGTPDSSINGKEGHENGVSVALQQDETERQSYADTDTRKMSGLEKDAKQAVHHFKIIDYGLANFEETYACGPDLTHDEAQSPDQQSEASGDSFSRRQPGCAIHFPIMLRRDTVDKLPKISPVEQLYRYMWRRKGDVYHILFNLGEWLDGRVWPRKDQLEVLRLMDLIHHVTGQRLRAWFRDAKGTSVATHARSGWSDKAFRPINRSGATLHFLRRWHLRLGAWTHPSNPGLTAAEALTAPFFTGHKSLRTVVTGGSTRYSNWTQPAKSPGKRAQRYPAPR